ncbi:hypothetical protein [Succinivibrio dextrinosolvens]|uniref:hypothetical protein n=1 Tax=Succinivibrio dextrinosolvens TaxID=83771 RepID=UPI00247B2128|nr:hypothetical protein [Succinivibrio dextrinosolvens]
MEYFQFPVNSPSIINGNTRKILNYSIIIYIFQTSFLIDGQITVFIILGIKGPLRRRFYSDTRLIEVHNGRTD